MRMCNYHDYYKNNSQFQILNYEHFLHLRLSYFTVLWRNKMKKKYHTFWAIPLLFKIVVLQLIAMHYCIFWDVLFCCFRHVIHHNLTFLWLGMQDWPSVVNFRAASLCLWKLGADLRSIDNSIIHQWIQIVTWPKQILWILISVMN
jgi:hypothetical protein